MRLESAVQDLIYTDKSVIKIALFNGFANVKSFNSVFKKKYGVPPQKFRQSHPRHDLPVAQIDFEKLSIHELEDFPELVRYIQFYDNSYRDSNNTDILNYSLAVTSDKQYFNSLKKILRIGKLSDALLAETQNQLNFAQNKLKCDYIHFQGIFCDGIHQYSDQSFYFYYEYNQTIQYFKNLDLTPFIRINLSDIIHANIDMAQAEETLTSFLQTMSKYFSIKLCRRVAV